MSGSFGTIDYFVFVGTLLVSVFIGVFYAFIEKQSTNADLLVGGRSMGIVPVAFSLMATYLSAISILGYSGEIYAYGTEVAEMIYGTFFFIPLSGFLFLPTLYNLNLTSAYEYLEYRFQSRAVRTIASATFIIQITMYSGVVLYAPSLALNSVVDVPVWASIVCMGGCAAIYTSIGGIKAVVWSDVFQVGVIFLGLFSVIIKGASNVGGLGNVFKIIDDHHRFKLLQFKIDPFARHSTLNIFFGHGMFWLSSYGCHQTTVQRYCSMSSLRKAFKTLFLTSPLMAFSMFLAVMAGVCAYANYADCDPMALGRIKAYDQIIPCFVMEYLSPISGLLGLFIACLFSGALSTVSSNLNSLAAVTFIDFCKERPYFAHMSDKQQGRVIKLLGLMYGGLSIMMGFGAGQFGGVLSAALTINGSVAGPLLGVFMLGILIPFTNAHGAIIGMFCGHVVTFSISIGSLILARRQPPELFSIADCSNETLSNANLTLAYMYLNRTYVLPELKWPKKIYTLSYLMFPLIGLGVTITMGTIVSFLTGRTRLTEDLEPYIHPVINMCNKKYRQYKKFSRVDFLNSIEKFKDVFDEKVVNAWEVKTRVKQFSEN